MKRSLGLVCLVMLAGLLVLGNPAGSAAASPSPAEFYKKNVVTMVIGTSPGAGADYAGRLVASYWSAATGGSMVVKNMTGAGGVVSTNYVTVSKPDGLTIGFGMFGSSYLSPHLNKDPAVKFNIHKMNWLFGAFQEPWGLNVSVKSPYSTVEDFKKAKGIKCAALSPLAPGSILESLFLELLGLDGRVITGYKGGAAMGLAAGKGEVDIVPQPTSVGLNSMKKGFVKDPVVVISDKKVASFPNSPPLVDCVKMTPEQEALYDLAVTSSHIVRVGVAPPGVPEDRIQFMRDAFAKIVEMDAFKKQVGLSFPLGPAPLMGEELNAFVKKAADTNMDEIKKLVNRHLAIRK
ncbi:MAG: tripartite tricarboxylate transporter substrate-binding protein [Pseudomonadota bacterium]